MPEILRPWLSLLRGLKTKTSLNQTWSTQAAVEAANSNFSPAYRQDVFKYSLAMLVIHALAAPITQYTILLIMKRMNHKKRLYLKMWVNQFLWGQVLNNKGKLI